MTTNAQEQENTRAERLAVLLAAYDAGTLQRPEVSASIAAWIFGLKVLASRWADILVSTLANRPPIGLQPSARHLERLQEAVVTVLDEVEATPEPQAPDRPEEQEPPPEPEEVREALTFRLERLADAEEQSSRQLSTRAAIEAQGFTHYRQEVAGDACEKCAPFRNSVHKSDEAWKPHHPRCRCELVPVNNDERNDDDHDA